MRINLFVQGWEFTVTEEVRSFLGKVSRINFKSQYSKEDKQKHLVAFHWHVVQTWEFTITR